MKNPDIQENIIKHDFKITRADREKIKNQKSILLWFTGLSGSGKSTIANELEIFLNKKNYHTYILDGDNTRKGINSDLDFSDSSRKENIRRVGEMANLFLDAGVIVIAGFISPFASDRQKVRELVGEENFVEIFINCPLEICEKRDVKGLYAKARKGEIKNFTGIDSPFEEPENPELVLHSNQETPEESTEKIIEYLKERIIINN